MKTRKINWSNAFKALTFGAIVALVFSVTDVQAADSTKTPPVEIRYIGNMNEKPVFQIEFDNESGEDVYLALRDGWGETIYGEWVKDKKYTRKIQIENFDVDELKITVVLRSKKGYQTQSFRISQNTRTVEDVAVAKL